MIKILDNNDEDAYFCIMTDLKNIISVKLIDLKKKTKFEIELKDVDILKFYFVEPDCNIKFLIANIITE